MKKNKKSNQFLINRFSLFGLGGGLLLLFMFFNGVAKGQVVSSINTLRSGKYMISSGLGNGTAADEGLATTKLLRYDSNKHIVFDMNMSRFLLITQDYIYAQYAEIPELFIKDFSILGDTLYFCGMSQNGEGFIAWFNITEVFYNGSETWNYTSIPTTTVVSRIETYNNSDGIPVVAGIGEQYYGKPPYFQEYLYPLVPCDDLHKLNPHDSIPHGYWTYPDSNYYDCFIINKITNNYDNATGNYYNDLFLYHHKDSVGTFYTDYVIGTSFGMWEQFRDIAITDNYICLVSVSKIDTSTFATTLDGRFGPGYQLILRRFDKNTFAQVSNTLSGIYGNNIAHKQHGFYLEYMEKHLSGYDTIFQNPQVQMLSGENIALAYAVNGVLNIPNVATHHLINKVDISTVPFAFIHGTLAASDIKSIRKPEYFPEISKLITNVSPGVVFNSQNIYNEFSYLDMNNNNVYNYMSNFNFQNNVYCCYQSQVFGIYNYAEPIPNSHEVWDYILRSNNNYFSISGRHTSGDIFLYDKQTLDLLSNQCQIVEDITPSLLESKSFDNFDDLEQCYYAVFEVNVFGFVVSGSPNPQYNYKPIIQKEKPIYIDKIEIEEICNEK